MQVNDFSKGALWAIRPEALENLFDTMRGFWSNDSGFNAAISQYRSRDPQEKDYEVSNGVALIQVRGPISKGSTFFSFMFGGTSTGRLELAVRSALEDGGVQAIVLDIDSPGGTIPGLESLGTMIFEARQQKPIVAFADGTMASGAYWLGSAAQEVIVAGTSQIGSIGVLMVHYDFSEEDRKMGLKRTYLTAGKYKAMGNSGEPLSSEARQYFQGHLDYFYGVFVDTVARNRGVDSVAVLESMADGRVFVGEQALAIGMVDQVGNIETAMETALEMTRRAGGRQFQTAIGGKTMDKNQVKIESVEQLAAAYPGLVTEIRETSVRTVDQAALRAEGAKSEQDRILAMAKVQFGEEMAAKFAKVIQTGVTVEQFQAIQAAAATGAGGAGSGGAGGAAGEDEAKRKELLAALQASGAANPGAGGQTSLQTDKPFLTLVDEYVMTHKTDKGVAIQACMKAFPEVYTKWLASKQVQ